MSAVFAILGPGGPAARRAAACTMQQRLRARGADTAAVWADGPVLLGSTAAAWEESGGAGTRGAIGRYGGIVVVADASLYYQPDLRRALRSAGIRGLPAAAGGADLIAAAYAAWGAECASRLEGDFAFIAWDGQRRRLLAARDATGTRPLFHAAVGEALVVASAASAVLAFPGCPNTLNLAAVARATAGFFAVDDETGYAAVSALPAGHRLVAEGGAVRVERFWQAPTFASAAAMPFDEAAAELRELLGHAVEERLSARGATAIWLSGGYDSTAVLAAGNARLQRSGGPGALRPVSVSYPPGDPGREDDWIDAAAARWGAPVQWLDAREIPLLDDPARRAATRDDVFAHAFEGWNAALARGSRAVGARVALTGIGGDQLFQVSAIFLADLARRGRWLRVWREWRARNPQGHLRHLLPWATGRRDYLARTLPAWIDRGFAVAHGLEATERQRSPARGGLSHAAFESHWLLTYGYRVRLMATLFGIGLAEGVEIRTPFFDERVLRFAAARPVEERASRGETKRLLRRSMQGLLPAELLAPRRVRTGTSSALFDRVLRERHHEALAAVFREPVLASLGVIDPHMLQRSCNDYLSGRAAAIGGALLATLHAELWVRSRIDLARPIA